MMLQDSTELFKELSHQLREAGNYEQVIKDRIPINPYKPFKLGNKYYIPIKEEEKGWRVMELTQEVCKAITEGERMSLSFKILPWKEIVGLVDIGYDPYW